MLPATSSTAGVPNPTARMAITKVEKWSLGGSPNPIKADLQETAGVWGRGKRNVFISDDHLIAVAPSPLPWTPSLPRISCLK